MLLRIQMTLHNNKQEKSGWQFVCTAGRSKCTKKKRSLSDSWFSKAILSIRTALLCIAGFAAELNTDQFAFCAGVKSKHTVVDWRSFFAICARM